MWGYVEDGSYPYVGATAAKFDLSSDEEKLSPIVDKTVAYPAHIT